MRLFKSIVVCLLFISYFSSASVIRFHGSVLDNASAARTECLDQAIKHNTSSICFEQHGTAIESVVKNITVTLKNEEATARVITLNYQ